MRLITLDTAVEVIPDGLSITNHPFGASGAGFRLLRAIGKNLIILTIGQFAQEMGYSLALIKRPIGHKSQVRSEFSFYHSTKLGAEIPTRPLQSLDDRIGIATP
jgi:hypothetical protein